MSLNEQLGIVTMYFKESCPYCKNAKQLLETKYGLKISYVDVEGDNRLYLTFV
jgi:glutaredoxin